MKLTFALGNLFAEFLKRFSIRSMLLIYFFGTSLGTTAFILYKFPTSIILMAINVLIVCAIFNNFLARLNDEIPEKIRATVLSVQGFIENVLAFVVLFFFGILVDYTNSYRVGFTSFSILCSVGIGFILYSIAREEKAWK